MLTSAKPRSRATTKAVIGQANLTAREHDVLRLMSQGLDNKTIADRLQLSVATVRGHVQRILEKLGAHSKLEAVVIASRKGLVRDLT